MMRLAKNQPERFYGDGTFYPYLLGAMKLAGGIITEGLNMFNLACSEDVKSVVADYIVFGFIAEIDDYMATTVTNLDVGAELETEIYFRKWYVAMSFTEEVKFTSDMI